MLPKLLTSSNEDILPEYWRNDPKFLPSFNNTYVWFIELKLWLSIEIVPKCESFSPRAKELLEQNFFMVMVIIITRFIERIVSPFSIRSQVHVFKVNDCIIPVCSSLVHLRICCPPSSLIYFMLVENPLIIVCLVSGLKNLKFYMLTLIEHVL